MQYSANTNLDQQEKRMFSDPALDYFCFTCDRFAEQSLQIPFPLYLPLPPPTRTHPPSHPCPGWLLNTHPRLLWRKLTLLSTPLCSIYITSLRVLNFSMLTMFPGSISLEQGRKKNLEVYYFFPPIYLTPPLESEQKAYCQADRPGQNVTVCSSRAQRYI